MLSKVVQLPAATAQIHSPNSQVYTIRLALLSHIESNQRKNLLDIHGNSRFDIIKPFLTCLPCQSLSLGIDRLNPQLEHPTDGSMITNLHLMSPILNLLNPTHTSIKQSITPCRTPPLFARIVCVCTHIIFVGWCKCNWILVECA